MCMELVKQQRMVMVVVVGEVEPAEGSAFSLIEDEIFNETQQLNLSHQKYFYQVHDFR